jgi:hypothetical protein
MLQVHSLGIDAGHQSSRYARARRRASRSTTAATPLWGILRVVAPPIATELARGAAAAGHCLSGHRGTAPTPSSADSPAAVTRSYTQGDRRDQRPEVGPNGPATEIRLGVATLPSRGPQVGTIEDR